MLRIAITGASGFIGKHLVPKLIANGHDIRLATRASLSGDRNISGQFRIDLVTATDIEFGLFLDGCDVLIHLAGEVTDQAKMRTLHVDATRRLAEAATATRLAHWVQLSSCGVYGPVRSGVISESAPKSPVGEYEVTKWESEEVVREWSEISGRKATILRPSIVWSADMPNGSLRALIAAVRRGMFFFIGKPGGVYPCVHVDDLVAAVIMATERGGGNLRVFNLSDNVPIEYLIGTIAELFGRSPPRLRVPQSLARAVARFVPALPLTTSRIDALTTRAIYSSKDAYKLLGWQPQKSLREGLRELAGVIAENGGII